MKRLVTLTFALGCVLAAPSGTSAAGDASGNATTATDLQITPSSGSTRRVRPAWSCSTEFFLRVVDAQLTFELGADGKATSVTLHQNGQNLPAKRIP